MWRKIWEKVGIGAENSSKNLQNKQPIPSRKGQVMLLGTNPKENELPLEFFNIQKLKILHYITTYYISITWPLDYLFTKQKGRKNFGGKWGCWPLNSRKSTKILLNAYNSPY